MKKEIKLLLLLTVFAKNVNSQCNWKQMGSSLYGVESNDFFGAEISLSKDGKNIVVGAPYRKDSNNVVKGSVKILKLISGTWQQIGKEIFGEALNDRFGQSVSINYNGTVVAIGAPSNDRSNTNCGQVKVFKLENDDWIQIGSSINGEEVNDFSGDEVILSGDGKVLAIGAPQKNYNGIQKGQIRIYKLNNFNNWIKYGNDIKGDNNYDKYGHSLTLNYDGSIMALGSHYSFSGSHVKVFKFNTTSGIWIQQGYTLLGSNGNYDYGISLSLNYNGNILAVGAPREGSGAVRVYQYFDNNWGIIGNIIYGKKGGDMFGYSVSINNDGNIIAIGAIQNSDSGIYRGQNRVFKLISDNWNQIGDDINGEMDNDKSGLVVSLSENGDYLAITSPANNINGFISGQVKVFRFKCPEPILKVKGNGKIIVDGTLTTQYNDSTDFGEVENGSIRKYLLVNEGDDTLKIINSFIFGSHYNDFTLINFPKLVLKNDSAYFFVSFNTTEKSRRDARVIFYSNYPEIYIFDFSISAKLKSNLISHDRFEKRYFSVAPNPANSELSIIYQVNDDNSVIEIIDATGKLIQIVSLNNESEILNLNITEWASGIYFVNLKSNGVYRGSIKLSVNH